MLQIIMERVEYTVDGNTLGVSVKYPKEINRKWSELHVEIVCDECGGDNISSNKKGDILLITCEDCQNEWYGLYNKVLTWYDTEEAFVNLFNIPFSEK